MIIFLKAIKTLTFISGDGEGKTVRAPGLAQNLSNTKKQSISHTFRKKRQEGGSVLRSQLSSKLANECLCQYANK